MDKNFKWHMLITSFLPLWISIIIIETFNLIKFGILTWNSEFGVFYNLWYIIRSNMYICIFLLVVIIDLFISLIKVNKFLSLQNKNIENLPMAEIKNLEVNSHLSTDFLVAYILPMLSFDFISLLHIVLFILYFSTLAFLSIRNNYVYVNIFLELKKYKVFIADLTISSLGKNKAINDCTIIGKKELILKGSEKIKYYDLENSIFLGVAMEEKNDN